MRLKKLSIIILLSIALTNLQAQTATVVTGGTASGTGGTANYTVGQVVYTTNTGTTGSVAQGVQQPFEIWIETGVEQQGINLECVIYPNPVTDYLILSIDNDLSKSQLSYQLFDNKGQMITADKLMTVETKIKTDNLIQGNYLLRVIGNDKAIKTFKIIKY